MQPELPPHHRALILEDRAAGFELKTRPTATADAGSAIVRIAAAPIVSYYKHVLRHYPFPLPFVGGYSGIGRVVAVGPDAVALAPGQLVYVDCVVRARDDPDAFFLSGVIEGFSEGSRKLMRDGGWRETFGTFAEYTRVPLENCIPLNEARLCGELGYSVPELASMIIMLVPYGGLRDVKVEPGDTVAVCPATGGFSSAGVQVAVAMGARVIAMARSEGKLAALKEHLRAAAPTADIETVVITGDVQADSDALRRFGPLDVVLELTPGTVSGTTHTRSALKALRRGGRVSLMGSAEGIDAMEIVTNDIVLRGKQMYGREDIVQFFKMLERGLFPRGSHLDVRTFKLEEWKEALDVAAEHAGLGKGAVFVL
ncbi:hypothetical protein C8A03DRAFT_39003 [Achaetomium macrosporum]|uniref:Alcohol dehydrogenase n=1 Tax=Achaetomium macrosporum TaxID=79813 RepID=A0AAN7H6R6_9PEZI|nr:hypothetical protein C8A03DRAFT_39003 [Achaetomium macrosporum]